MAQTAIPGLDVNDPAMERMARRMRAPTPTPNVMYGTPQGVALDPGAAEAARRFSTQPPMQPQPTMRNAPPNAGPQRPLPESRPWAPGDGMAKPPVPEPMTERIRGAGAATGQGIRTAGQATGEALKTAGRAAAQDVLRGGMRSTGVLSGISETAGHGNAYFDDNVPLTDRLRIGATDAVSAVGSTLGAVGGGAFGAGVGSVVPVAGTITGGVAGAVGGGYLGRKAGHGVGNFLFGGDDALVRNGYDPKRNIIDVAKSAVSGEDGSTIFGRGNAAAGQGRGFINPPMASELPDFPPNSQGQPGGTVPGAGVPMPANPAGTIRRVGNSYSGENIGFGADIDNPRNPSKGVTSLPGGAASMRGYELPQSVTTGDGGSTVGQGPLGFGGGTLVDSLRAKHFSTPSASILTPGSGSMKPRDARHAAGLAAEQAIATARMANERGLATMREGGDMARANLSANVQRENNAATTNATMRGQDMTYQGHVLSVRQAQAAAQRAQANTDREYMRATGNDAFARKEGRDKQLTANLESINPGQDGKPDQLAVAEQRRGIDRSVARMGASGVHELSPLDEQRLLAGTKMLKTMQANANWLPWNPDKLKTIDPVDLTQLRVLPNGDRQITRADSKAAGQIIPRRFFDTVEGARFFGGTPTNEFDILHEGGK